MDIHKIIIPSLAKEYISKNPERFTPEEIKKFNNDLNNYLNNKSKIIDDEVFDFLVYKGLINNGSRHNQFAKYINSKYAPNTTPNILDVGAGRMCHLSHRLSRSGYNMTAIDPKIRLTDSEAQAMNLKIERNNFYCDEYAPQNTSGTPINDYDLLVGLEPCDATEHIIRQGLKYNKPFEVLLCYTAHKKLTGGMPQSPEAWYKYLRNISSEIEVKKYDDSFIATNN